MLYEDNMQQLSSKNMYRIEPPATCVLLCISSAAVACTSMIRSDDDTHVDLT